MKILFTDAIVVGEGTKNARLLASKGEIKACKRIESIKGDPNHVLLTLVGLKTPIEVNGRNIRVITHPTVPDFRADVWLVKYGYQVDYYSGNRALGSECRDFGGSHRISSMVQWLLKNFDEMLGKMRKEH